MGQYNMIVNLDKREYLYPHKFGDGFKLMEFGQSAGGTLTGLTILLAGSNGRGGGDFHGEGAGGWAGDRIAIIGDYWEVNDVPGLTADDMQDLWSDDPLTWTDKSDVVVAVLKGADELGEWQANSLERRAAYKL